METSEDSGIKVGAYHYFSLAYGGYVQADNFINVVPIVDDQLPPVVDLEYAGHSKERPTKEHFQKELKIYLDIIKQQYGKEPIIYTTNEFYYDYLYPELLPPKEHWLFWQFTQWGMIDGIKGSVDLNFFRGSISDLENIQ